MNIGLDAGGVIFIQDRTHIRGDTSQTEQFMPDCLEYVEKLVKDDHRIFFNSFAGKVRGENTRKAIEQNMKEWIPKDNVFVVGVKIYTSTWEELYNKISRVYANTSLKK